ncbi:MAG TPA: prephenate dehydratase [Calditrichaeota bacterium]|nr:prephenate dehydratase [Calditrichota bacterium]
MDGKRIIKIGYQGEKGAYSTEAIDTLYAEREVEKVPFRTSYEVVDGLKKEIIDYGLLPIENSIIGNITHNYDLLLENKLTIVKEVIIPIHHFLLGCKGTKLNEITRIYSHPAAISQCEVFLRKFSNADILPTYDTAGSAKMIAEKKLKNTAAIASQEAASIYGLDILQERIEDYPHNRTRFLLVSSEPLQVENEPFIPWKVSAVFDTLDQHGMLYRCLGIFDEYAVNLSLLTSRPHKTEPWKYHFFVDVDGHANDENVAQAFEKIKKLTGFVHIFGSYPRFEAEDSEVFGSTNKETLIFFCTKRWVTF